MRTKALVGLAVLAAGAATCLAQGNVYSLNIVGYVNVPLEANKFALIANPLTPSGGNTYNTNNIVLGADVTDATIYKWTGSSYAQSIWYGGDVGWDPAADLPVGDAFFIKSAQATTITFVGEVATGTVSQTIPTGTSLKANKVPVSEPWPLKANGNIDDTIYTWSGTGWNSTWIYYGATEGWIEALGAGPDGPTLAPGQGVAYTSKGATALTWTRTFDPNVP
jgi:hypothetical protein